MIQIEISNNERIVKPYAFVFQMRAKPKWKNLSINEIYAKFYPEIHFDIQNIKVNSKIVGNGHIPKENDLIEHFYSNRTEPSVSSFYDIVYNCKDYLVVHKPSLMPVHPCGRYHYNSLSKILEHDGFGEIHTIHRLDLQTEGLVLLARNKSSAAHLSNLFKEKRITKKYLAKVVGKFPQTSKCDQSVLKLSNGKCVCSQEGKSAISNFKLIKYDSETNTSLVECEPITGRTHQLRVHLAYLNHPIVDDLIYRGNKDKHDGAISLLAASMEFDDKMFKITKLPKWVSF